VHPPFIQNFITIDTHLFKAYETGHPEWFSPGTPAHNGAEELKAEARNPAVSPPSLPIQGRVSIVETSFYNRPGCIIISIREGIHEMSIKALGLNSWIENSLDKSKLKAYQLARVFAVDKDSFIVRGERGESRAELTGKLMYTAGSSLDYPTVGDWVYVQYFDDDSFSVIHEIVPRKTVLKRKTSGKKIEFQLIAANIDTAFIMQSLDSNYNLQRLERYLVLITESGIRPVILLSKSDLLTQDEIQARLLEVQKRMPGVPAVSFSNLNDSGMSAVNKLLVEGETFCLLGSSGVGKTTLVNKLLGREAFETRAIREKDDKGRHTTSRRQLTLLDNGALLVDTPGMRELGVFGVESGIDTTFGEITELAGQCRFSDCSHTKEKGCAVLSALKDGSLTEKRYENFLKMARESAHYSMSYLEKRRKDKAFAKMCKTVMKDHKKK
jgi:ribosome biogenesis GTPase